MERSNRELDEFAYIASHDLRSPLHGIENLVNFIREDTEEILPEPSRMHLAKLRARVKRMDTLLTDLLAYSRATRQSHQVELVDPAALLGEVVELVAPPPGFTITIAEPMPTLLTERVPLATVFRNLVSNAVKHHHRTDGKVLISARQQIDLVKFVVADDGPGIAPVFHERIFDIFQTLKPRDQVEGSGMGLALVKKIVERFGGSVGLDSAESQGASFWFTWPC